MGWVGIIIFVRCTSPAERQIPFSFVGLEGWCTRRQAVCVWMLSAAAAAESISVCKYVNISTTSEFVLMAFCKHVNISTTAVKHLRNLYIGGVRWTTKLILITVEMDY